MTHALDRYDYYERAVQSPAMQARFLRALHGAPSGTALTLGEDFCGSGAISRAWAEMCPDSRVIATDRDPDAIAALERRLSADAAPRVRLVTADVREAPGEVDVICALNFATCELHERSALLEYLRAARRRLRPEGALVVDLYGGAEAHALGESEVELRDGVRYVWEQREADPLTGRVVNAMHFHPDDGPPMMDAFVYHWRLWSAPEMRDAMLEAGFATVEAHDRLGDAIDDDGDVLTMPIDSPNELDETFVIYLVARGAGQSAAQEAIDA